MNPAQLTDTIRGRRSDAARAQGTISIRQSVSDMWNRDGLGRLAAPESDGGSS